MSAKRVVLVVALATLSSCGAQSGAGGASFFDFADGALGTGREVRFDELEQTSEQACELVEGADGQQHSAMIAVPCDLTVASVDPRWDEPGERLRTLTLYGTCEFYATLEGVHVQGDLATDEPTRFIVRADGLRVSVSAPCDLQVGPAATE